MAFISLKFTHLDSIYSMLNSYVCYSDFPLLLLLLLLLLCQTCIISPTCASFSTSLVGVKELFVLSLVEPCILSGSYSLLYNYTFVTLPFILHYPQCCLYSPCSLSPMGFSSSTLLGYRATGSIYYQSSFITLPSPVLPHNSMRIQST
jgi:hypothetical protein